MWFAFKPVHSSWKESMHRIFWHISLSKCNISECEGASYPFNLVLFVSMEFYCVKCYAWLYRTFFGMHPFFVQGLEVKESLGRIRRMEQNFVQLGIFSAVLWRVGQGNKSNLGVFCGFLWFCFWETFLCVFLNCSLQFIKIVKITVYS